MAAGLLSLGFSVSGQAALCYVNGAAETGANDGSSWDNAYVQLQSALADAGCTEVWVARGLYKPGTTQTDHFDIRSGTAVYGGFRGDEIVLAQRDPAANPTILSADIDDNDVDADGNHTDETTADIVGNNARHVLTMDGITGTPITASTVLDGFVVTAGDATGTLFPDSVGGGLYCAAVGAGHVCSPTLATLAFSGNRAVYGGAIYNDGNAGDSSPTLTRVTFSGNLAGNSGGAIYNDGQSAGVSSPVLTDIVFTNNLAEYGGAMVNNGESGTSSPTVTKVTFAGNSATYAGAMYNDGIDQGVSRPILTNVTFSGNSATYGGAIIDNGMQAGVCAPILDNVTFNGNSANYGGAIYIYGVGGTSSATLVNVILWGDAAFYRGAEIYNGGGMPTIGHSVIDGGLNGNGIDNENGGIVVDGGGNLARDPILEPLGDNGGFTRTMALGEGSSAIDSGDDAICPATDQTGMLRPQGAHCDIGAFEARADLLFADGFDP
ncbi:MAG TPA: choice-of-anchor Q domain-containing protein [Rhodanobacteraceae bacterium]|nr:choice-of-anchor Q domain-containing protein [Rhodanobacteraceae bacterium]